jgi:uncharacterized protein YybS (DUF2232 family)
MNERLGMSVLFPLLAILLIAVYAGGLGVIFMMLEATGLGEWGPILLGVILVVAVPVLAYMLQQRVERQR